MNHVKKVHIEHLKSESVQADMFSLQNVEKGTFRLNYKIGSVLECGMRVTADQCKYHYEVHYCCRRI